MNAFAVGDLVRTLDASHDGHHRIPRYARGRCGTVVSVHPSFPVPDDVVAGVQHAPETVYSVQFDAEMLWGLSAERLAANVVDVWERFLGKVPDHEEARLS